MARASDGTYTRVSNTFSQPSLNVVIDPTHADALFDDLETEMTDSLSRSGKGAMLADLQTGAFSVLFSERSAPSSPAADKLALYAKDVSGTTALFTKDSAGTETQISPLDATLIALAALNSTAGLLVQTAADTFTKRTLQAPAAGIGISNPAGTAGDPTFSLANDLAALEGLSSTGIARRTGSDAWSVGTLVSYAEIQNVSATDKVLGRSTAGAGSIEEIAFTPVARTLAAQTTQALMRTTGLGFTAAGDALAVAADAAAQRTALGLGTAALKNTGTSGDAVPLLNVANTWSQHVTVNLNAGSLPASPSSGIQIGGVDGTAPTFGLECFAAASQVIYRRANNTAASPSALATNDIIGNFAWRGYGATGYGAGNRIRVAGFAAENWSDAAQGTYVTISVTAIGGTTLAQAFKIFDTGGVNIGAPTGGDKGVGTLNAVGVYDDNTLLTDIVGEFLSTGRIDLDKWDGMVPDLVIPEEVIPEERQIIEVEEEVEIQRLTPEIVRKDGKLVAETGPKLVKRKKLVKQPVHDAAGKVIGEVMAPELREVVVTERQVIPEKRIKRRHEAAHVFAKLIEDGFDPRDPKKFVSLMRSRGALPGMPNEAEWKHSKFSLGELQTRAVLASELLAAAVAAQQDQIEDLARRLAALEK